MQLIGVLLSTVSQCEIGIKNTLTALILILPGQVTRIGEEIFRENVVVEKNNLGCINFFHVAI